MPARRSDLTPLAEQLFPPELIMQHQQAIRLTEAQRTALIAEIKRVQGAVVDQQFEMQRAVERLVELLKPDRPDENQVLAQLDRVLAIERDVKRMHIGLAVRLKNLLTAEQLAQLRALRVVASDVRKSDR
jgi:Spy/CpxP family protein refolding chaperone